jgi:hypothetical protein
LDYRTRCGTLILAATNAKMKILHSISSYNLYAIFLIFLRPVWKSGLFGAPYMSCFGINTTIHISQELDEPFRT